MFFYVQNRIQLRFKNEKILFSILCVKLYQYILADHLTFGDLNRNLFPGGKRKMVYALLWQTIYPLRQAVYISHTTNTVPPLTNGSMRVWQRLKW